MLKWLTNIGEKISIDIDGHAVDIHSSMEFSFCCSGRTAIPQHRLTEIAKSDADTLSNEANQLHRLDNLMKGIVEQEGVGVGTGIRQTFSDITPASISQDHNWRDIFEALRGAPPKHGSLLQLCRRIAIDSYRTYLSNRGDAINGMLLARRSSLLKKDVMENSKQAIFSPEIIETGLEDIHYERIPKGETVTVYIKPGEDLDLLLSRHKCKLIHENEKLKFISNAQHDPIPIHPGRTAIGRDTINDIVLDAAWRDVSRIHLVITHNGDELKITDMSSYGTFLPIHLIARDKEALH